MSVATGQRHRGLGDRRRSGDHLRDGQAGQAGRRRRRRPLRRHDGAGDGAGPDGGARRRGLLPAHRRRRGADVRRREDPGRLLQARGTPHRAGDPDRAHDRPPDPAALAEGLPQRGAGDLHRALGRPRHAARHPLHQRRLGGADDLAAAVHRAGRRRPHRDDRRPARHQPDAAGDREREHARPDRRRHQGRADDGRGRRRRGPRGHAARRRSSRPTARSSSSARRRRTSRARPASRSGSTRR